MKKPAEEYGVVLDAVSDKETREYLENLSQADADRLHAKGKEIEALADKLFEILKDKPIFMGAAAMIYITSFLVLQADDPKAAYEDFCQGLARQIDYHAKAEAAGQSGVSTIQ